MAFTRLVLALVIAGCAFAQHAGHTPPGEKPVALIPGLGTWKHRIETKNPEAQKYFDQGLTLTYGFNRYEALRSFRKATELDPNAPMAWWGVAYSLAPYVNMDGDPSYNIKESCAALEKGLALKPQGREKDYFEAARTRCPDYADPARYIAASKTLAAKYPDDLDAQVLYVESIMVPVRWRWYSADGKPAEGMADAERVLEAVLRRDPTHAGANHYYIHAVESSPTPERAVASAQRLMGLVPAAGHVVHMPAHIWLVLGDFNMTASVNERAAQVDRQYFASTGVNGSYYMYFLHNLSFVLYARQMQGRTADVRKAEKAILDAATPMVGVMPEMATIFNSLVTMSQLRTARWDEVLAAPKPPADNALANAVWRYSRAIAQTMKGRPAEAAAERAAFEEARAKTDRTAQWGVNKLGDVMDLASTILEARAQPTPAASVALWRKAVTIQDGLAYDEPPAWYYPVRESLGAALLRAGDAAGAEAVFRDALARSPHNGHVLFGLLESLKAQNKTDAMEAVQKEFDAAWKGAEVKLRIEEL